MVTHATHLTYSKAGYIQDHRLQTVLEPLRDKKLVYSPMQLIGFPTLLKWLAYENPIELAARIVSVAS